MNPYCRIIPRLNGVEIEENFDYYLGLVKKGVAGFIVFGGELETLRAKIKELQNAARHPLIISSDLEQGLGQHVNGGTIFPPAMAIGSAIRTADKQTADSLLKKLYKAFALEAHYAGINVIFAPVLDINTNPENPIIATRAFGEDAETVSCFGCEMIKVLEENGILSCGKHFPGHGDTETDSHISLPSINKTLPDLEAQELIPFSRAINAGVSMIMLGHLRVPSMEPSGLPVSLSGRAVSYLRKTMGFNGFLITDAMNMGGLRGFTEEEASFMALKAGVDLILHPSDPDATAAYLLQKNYLPQPLALNLDVSVLSKEVEPDISAHKKLSDRFSEMAVEINGVFKIKDPFILVLSDDSGEKGIAFISSIKQKHPLCGHYVLSSAQDIPWNIIPEDKELIVCIFSEVRAWKGNANLWLRKAVEALKGRVKIFISFGNPYILYNIGEKVACIYAFWNSEASQKAAAERLFMPCY